ncbi:MAG: aromatic ring-hydroxylating dioxygenase subunit alpha [Alphaproteobacteria bacterium]|nr:aromatic ring-hydroxylating dioxygenase subunit alpha [Alphaproteobacteria bacterium]
MSVLSDEEFSATVRSISGARGLPNRLYVDPESAEAERQTVFRNNWTGIGFAHDVPNAGDAVPVTFLGWPLLMLRDRKGRVKVFHNVCRHRGHPLIDKKCSGLAMLRCPYHSWAYGLDGSLRSTPLIGGVGVNEVEGFDRSRFNLVEVRSEVWFGVVFIDMSGVAPPLSERTDAIEARWPGADLARLVSGGDRAQFALTVECNWKLAVENYCEAYHLPFVHPDLNSYSPLEDHYTIAERHFAGQGSMNYKGNDALGGKPFPEFEAWPAEKREIAEYVAFFPNVLFGIHRDHGFAILLIPQGPARTEERIQLFYVGDTVPEDPAMASVIDAHARQWRQVFEEDLGVVAGMQRGRTSPGFDGGVFSPVLETPTHAFHRWTAEQLNG